MIVNTTTTVPNPCYKHRYAYSQTVFTYNALDFVYESVQQYVS